MGHTYPLFAKFKGGKAVATSGGIILGINPILFAVMVLSFITTLYISKYVSLSSMVTGIIAIIVSALFRDLGLIIVTAALTILCFTDTVKILNGLKTRPSQKLHGCSTVKPIILYLLPVLVYLKLKFLIGRGQQSLWIRQRPSRRNSYRIKHNVINYLVQSSLALKQNQAKKVKWLTYKIHKKIFV